MDVGATKGLLELLFGNLGALGTLFVVVAVYQAWLLWEERKAHTATRAQMEELGEKRLELHVQNVELLKELQHALEALRTEVMKRRRI